MLIEFGVEDRLDTLAGRRTDGQRPPAGGFQALVAAVLGEVEQTEAGAVALFRMRAVIELPLHHGTGGRTDAESPVEQSPRRPLQMFAMGVGHVFGDGGVATAQE